MYFLQVTVHMKIIPTRSSVVYLAADTTAGTNIVAYNTFAQGIYKSQISTTTEGDYTLRMRYALCIDNYMLFNTETSMYTSWYNTPEVITNDKQICIYSSARTDNYSFSYILTPTYTIDIFYIA